MVDLKDINLTTILEDMPLPMLIIDPSRDVILWANSSAENWFERSRRAMVGKTLSSIITDKAAVGETIDRVLKTNGAVIAHDIVTEMPGGVRRPCSLTAFPLEQGVAFILRSEDRGSVQTPDMSGDAVGALGRMLAHELKNPLAGIKGAAQLLASEATSDEAAELISLISTETDRIHRLADRMESFGDFNLANAKPVNIHAILRQARLLAQSSSKSDIKFTEIYDPSLPMVLGDNDALMQVAINLIVNASEAIDSTRRPGEIILKTAYRAGLRKPSASGDMAIPIEIRIMDNGPGISSELIDKIFQPFITDKPAGRGLGLTLVSKIIGAHGGLVDVQSEPGKTVFSLHLPASEIG